MLVYRKVARLSLLSIGLLAIVALACSPFGGGGQVTGTRITIANTGSDNICNVFISASAEDSWGDDKLGDQIGPGQSRSFSVDAGVEYDLRVDDCQDRNLDERYSLVVQADQELRHEIETGGTGTATVTLNNQSQSNVCYVYISRNSSDGWGGDLLGSEEVIGPGTTRSFDLVSGHAYDLKAEDCDRNTLNELYGEQISAGDDLKWDVGS